MLVVQLTRAPGSARIDMKMESKTLILHLHEYDSPTNHRLRNPSHAQSIAEDATASFIKSTTTTTTTETATATVTVADTVARLQTQKHPQQSFRVVLGLGPGRSGTKSLAELLRSQISHVLHCEHEMIVPRVYPRTPSGRIDIDHVDAIDTDDNNNIAKNQDKKKSGNKGSWGAERRLEWDAPKLARGESRRTEKEEAMWRMIRLVEQWKAFEGWVVTARGDYHRHEVASESSGATTETKTTSFNNDGVRMKPMKLMGGRGWRDYNDRNRNDCKIMEQEQYSYSCTKPSSKETDNDDQWKSKDTNNNETISTTNATASAALPVVAAVSSVGLAYVHEYIALDPSVKIVVLLRQPCHEVVNSFMKKSRGRNHWQRHEHCGKKKGAETNSDEGKTNHVQRDKTWDSAFPNMSDEECRLAMMQDEKNGDEDDAATSTTNEGKKQRPDKVWAIRAYCKLYNDVAHELTRRYPNNVRIYDMHDALNDMSVQENLLNWCGLNEVVLDTSLHLNKKST